MKTYFPLIIFLFFLILSCSKKEVQLPKIEFEGIHEIQNHSSIWIFFDTEDQDTLAVLNKNNKLLNTHWIFNIDKRLVMKKIIPFLEEMQEDRNKDSMHKKEGMFNYFSYADMADNKVALLNFPKTNFVFTDHEFTTVLEQYTKDQVIQIDLDHGDLYLNQTKTNVDQVAKELKQKIDSLSGPKVYFKYSENTNYQDYLNIKAAVLESGSNLEATEYMYN